MDTFLFQVLGPGLTSLVIKAVVITVGLLLLLLAFFGISPLEDFKQLMGKTDDASVKKWDPAYLAFVASMVVLYLFAAATPAGVPLGSTPQEEQEFWIFGVGGVGLVVVTMLVLQLIADLTTLKKRNNLKAMVEGVDNSGKPNISLLITGVTATAVGSWVVTGLLSGSSPNIKTGVWATVVFWVGAVLFLGLGFKTSMRSKHPNSNGVLQSLSDGIKADDKFMAIQAASSMLFWGSITYNSINGGFTTWYESGVTALATFVVGGGLALLLNKVLRRFMAWLKNHTENTNIEVGWSHAFAAIAGAGLSALAFVSSAMVSSFVSSLF